MNSFGSRSTLRVGSKQYEIYRLSAVEAHGCVIKHLPYSLRILLENLLRREDGKAVKADDVRALTGWNSKSVPSQEIAFMPSRVLLQDFTGVPAVVDLAAMRDAMKALGGDPGLINPLQPAELVIDHSVQVDEFGTPQAFQLNAELEFSRNKERYAFLRWGQGRVQELRDCASGHGHRAPDQSGIPGAGGVCGRERGERQSDGVSGHAGGDGLAYHDD